MSQKVAAIGFALGVHALALGLLVFSFAQKPEPLGMPTAKPEAVEAVVVEDSRVQDELRRLRSDEQAKQQAEQARQRRAQQELDAARKAKDEETKRLAALKQQREQERAAAEQQARHLAELKAQQAKMEKERAALEKKRQEEQQRLADAQKRRKDAEKAEQDRKMREQIAAEEKRLTAERRQRLGRLANQYQLSIANQVRRNWLRPAGNDDEFECRVAITQNANGEVSDVHVIRSCGNAALDRSVEAAVRKASPLPSPPDPALFDTQIEFIFKP